MNLFADNIASHLTTTAAVGIPVHSVSRARTREHRPWETSGCRANRMPYPSTVRKICNLALPPQRSSHPINIFDQFKSPSMIWLERICFIQITISHIRIPIDLASQNSVSDADLTPWRRCLSNPLDAASVWISVLLKPSGGNPTNHSDHTPMIQFRQSFHHLNEDWLLKVPTSKRMNGLDEFEIHLRFAVTVRGVRLLAIVRHSRSAQTPLQNSNEMLMSLSASSNPTSIRTRENDHVRIVQRLMSIRTTFERVPRANQFNASSAAGLQKDSTIRITIWMTFVSGQFEILRGTRPIECDATTHRKTFAY
jgi:hypothetical protein